VYKDGQTERFAFYPVRGVSTGDSIDLADDFIVVKMAAFMAATVNGAGVCAVEGTVVTITPVGLSGDAGFLIARGSAA
jgi:hypothetical protein